MKNYVLVWGAAMACVIACGNRVAKSPAGSEDGLRGTCESGDARSCIKMGAQFAQGVGVPKDGARALAYFEKACALKDPTGCIILGASLYDGKYVAQDERRALRVFEGLCATEMSEGCALAGVLLWKGHGIKHNAPRAQKLLDQACAQGDEGACRLRRMVSDEGAKEPVTERSLEHAEALCDLGIGLYCTHAAASAKEASKANALFGRGCDAKEPVACFLLGTRMIQGDKMAADESAGVALLDKACVLGYGGACNLLGNAYAQGEFGLKQDPPRGVQLQQRACESESDDGCIDWALAIYLGKGVQKDTARAREIVSGPCQAGVARACATLAVFFIQGGEHAQAAPYMQRACELGHEMTCKALGKTAPR